MIIKYEGMVGYTTQVEYHRNKTGPNYFIVYYKQRSVVCMDRIEVKRCFGPAKFTPAITELGKWCDEMIDKYETKPEKTAADLIGVLSDEVKATGFGPECHTEELSNDELMGRMVI